jgi:hypothetical protein
MTRPRKADDGVLVAALAIGKTHAEAARISGVSERTIGRRLQDPDFEARVRGARAEVTATAAARINGLLPKAISSMDAALDHDDVRIQLRAADLVCKTSLEFRRTDLDDRVRALEHGSDPDGFGNIQVIGP